MNRLPVSPPPEAPVAAAITRPRVRAFLVRLVLASLVPGLVGAAIIFVHEYENDLRRREQDVVAVSRALVQAVDAQLARARVLAQALATAGAIRDGDFESLRRRASQLVELTGSGANVVLTDPTGQQVMNTLSPPGKPLPRHGNEALFRQVLQAGRPAVSEVYVGGFLGKPVLSVDVPVWLDERVAYVLSVGLLPADFERSLRSAGLPSHWVVALFDRGGTIVARTHGAEELVGQKGTPEFIERIGLQGEGTMYTTTREGIEVMSAFSRSPDTGWSVGIGIPRTELAAELRKSLGALALLYGALVTLGLALALALGGRISRSVRALIEPAEALGSGRDAPVPNVEVREVAEVARAIGAAGGLLRLRADALEQVNASLREREAELAQAQRIARLGSWRWDLASGRIHVSDDVQRLFGPLPGRFEDTRGGILADEAWRRVEAAARQAAATGEGFEMQLMLRGPGGAAFWADVRSEVVRNAAGEVVGLMGTVQDVTERVSTESARREAEAALLAERETSRQRLEREVAERTAELRAANERLERLAREDAMTGMANRMAAGERLRSEFLRMKRTGQRYAVLLIDVDHFKRVNDRHGHEAGDRVLQRFALALHECMRETDFVARYGGEEFIALLPDTDAEGAQRTAEKIRACVAATEFPVVGKGLTTSVGVALANLGDVAEDDAARRADTALYRSKELGRNVVTVEG